MRAWNVIPTQVARVSKRWRDSSAWDLGVLARWGYVDMNEAAVDLTNA